MIKTKNKYIAALIRLFKVMLIIYFTLFCIQRYLIFPTYIANSYKVGTPTERNLTNFNQVTLVTSDGLKIDAWEHAPSLNMPIILYLHGNGNNIAARSERYKNFVNAGYGIFAVDYRGYGNSEGSPSEEGLYKDARAAMNWLEQHYKTPILIYGESLGTGVAVQMGLEYRVSGIILQSGYTSISDIAAENYWFLPVIKYLVLDKFDSLSKISQIINPILIIHGDIDNVIPIEHSRRLAAANKEHTKFITANGYGHMNIPDDFIITEMKKFFKIN